VFDRHGKLIAIEGIARDITAEYALQEQVAYQANHDQLTGLMNRYAFDQYLGELIKSIDKHAASAVMCFIDMDRFKLGAVDLCCTLLQQSVYHLDKATVCRSSGLNQKQSTQYK